MQNIRPVMQSTGTRIPLQNTQAWNRRIDPLGSIKFKSFGDGDYDLDRERLSLPQELDWIQRICLSDDPVRPSYHWVGLRPDESPYLFYFDWLDEYRRHTMQTYEDLTFDDIFYFHKIIFENIKQSRKVLREAVLEKLKSISLRVAAAAQAVAATQHATQPPTTQATSMAQLPDAVQSLTTESPTAQSPAAQAATAQPPTAQLPTIQPPTNQNSTAQPTATQASVPVDHYTITSDDIRHANEIIELVVMFSFLTNIEFCDTANEAARSKQLPFLPDQSLWKTLRKGQPKPVSHQSLRYDPPPPWHEFPQWLNAVSWEKATGIKIRWTSVLNEHLVVNDQTLLLFGNVEILRQMKGSKTQYVANLFLQDIEIFSTSSGLKISSDGLFSGQFIDETIDSVLLFFPKRPRGYYSKWFRNHGGDMDWQRALERDGRRDRSRVVSDYPIWRRQLISVAKASKSTETFNLKRLWHDNRDETMWWTKWALILAVFLTVVFGLIQSIAGIIQVVYAARSG